MKSLSLLGTFLVALSLAACGGGSDGSGGSGRGGSDGGEQPPAIKLNSSAQIIEYHGDSTVWGYRSGTTGDRVETPAPDAFAAALPQYHEVRNRGLNRSTACDLLEGTGGYEQAWQEYMATSDATVVIINHGINDMSEFGIDTSPYRNCLNQLVEIAQANEKVVILETPNPAVGSSNGAEIIDYVEAMRDVAEQQNVDLIDQYAQLREAFEADASEVCPDGVHPSEEVYIDKGQFAAEQFATFNEP